MLGSKGELTMPNTAKQEAIRKAYGELYEKIDRVMFTQPHEKWYNLWLDTGKFYYNFMTEGVKHELSNLETDNLDGFCWLKSLQGIETNNGWIRIESAEYLPRHKVWLTDGNRIWDGYLFTAFSDERMNTMATHFQTILKPEKPIY